MSSLLDAVLHPSLTDPKVLLVYIGAFAAVLILSGAYGFYASRDRAVIRMRALTARDQPKLVRNLDIKPSGWKKALIPEDPSDRAQIQFQLSKVGFDHPKAVEIFYVLRLVFALSVPALVLAALALAEAGLLPGQLASTVRDTSHLRLLQIAAVGAAVGFYGPGYWLKSRIDARRLKIRNAFPNALDLLQISVEAGLGFDAALIRVGQEIGRVAPEISYEFLLLQIEIQAGADREKAMFAMADRMGIPEAKSFALVIVQSLQFGTSLTASLRNFAIEMRINRELAAQEKANKLPVQMSAVMSLLMLPALFLITLTPVILRYMAMY